MKNLSDELQENEMSFGDMHSPHLEVNKRVRSDVYDDPDTSRLFLTTINALRSSLMQ